MKAAKEHKPQQSRVILKYVPNNDFYNKVTQCCRHDESCTYSDPCPIHEFSQINSAAHNKYIKPNKRFIGEDAMNKQAIGKAPKKEEVRVKSIKLKFSRCGVGLDELLPTDQLKKVAKSKILGIAGIQSGLRIPTSHSVLFANGFVSGHTGMFPKKTGRGSTNLTGQSAAHDLRRIDFIEQWTREVAVAELALNSLKSLANGRQIINASELESAVPNFIHVQPIKGLNFTSIGLASIINEAREHYKQRLRTYINTKGLKIPRSVSPVRGPIEVDGSGGEYNTSITRPSSPLPFFPGDNDNEISANETAWITAPYYPDSTSVITRTIPCPNCGINVSSYHLACPMCFHSLKATK